jgi:hypothetical protein
MSILRYDYSHRMPFDVLLILFVPPVLLALLASLPALLVVDQYLHNTFDLGLYSQALKSLSFSDLNPWLSVYVTNVFNDHFDPILLVAAPLANLMEPRFAGVLAEWLFVSASTLAPYWLWRERRIDTMTALFAASYLVLNYSAVGAVGNPFHPTTWACLPMAFLATALVLNRFSIVVAALIALFACKEEFPFVGFAVGFLFLLRRELSRASVVIGISVAWLAFAMWLRPILFGPVTPYWEVTNGLFRDPLGAIFTAITQIDLIALGSTLAPILPLVVNAARRPFPTNTSIGLLALPPLGIRFLGGAWINQYLVPLAPLFLFTFLPSAGTGLGEQATRRHRAALILCFGLLAVTLIVPAARAALTYAGSVGVGPQSVDRARLVSIQSGIEFLFENKEGRALVGGNLTAPLAARDQIYHVGMIRRQAAIDAYEEGVFSGFRYVFVEKNAELRETWPLTGEDYRKRIEGWRATPGAQVIIDDPYVFLAEGSFSDELGPF